jgi:hypothetical protein
MHKLMVGLGGMALSLGLLGGAHASTILSEGFTTVVPAGWVVTNNSAPIGTTSWFQGNTAVFSAQAGPANSYAAANFLAAADGGNISDWLLTPTVTLHNGDVFSFYTRTETASAFADSLQVLLSTSGASTNVGSTATSVGDFTTTLFSINPTQLPTGYPDSWTQFSTVLSGLAPAGASGRIGFRYVVTNTAVNGNYIGVDTVSITTTVVPEPGTLAVLALGLAVMGWHLRRGSAR